MYIKNIVSNYRWWLFSSLIGVAILYLNLIWKTTGNIDQLTTDILFWGTIIWLLWRKKDVLQYDSDFISSFLGLMLLGLILAKTLTLFWFESSLLSLLPLSGAIALALIASGFIGLGQYIQELFFAWFLFFPTGVIGHFIDNLVHITILNAKFATYLLYYCGFEVATQDNQVILSLPELGNFKAIVDYPCAGMPMILLMLKLALLLISLITLSPQKRLLIPLFSMLLGFSLGVIRVSILTLLIPYPSRFDYWHGSSGSQFFSTLAIIIFSAFCYWLLEDKLVEAEDLRPEKNKR